MCWELVLHVVRCLSCGGLIGFYMCNGFGEYIVIRTTCAAFAMLMREVPLTLGSSGFFKLRLVYVFFS